MTSRQERTAKATKKAEQQASQIVEEAVAKVTRTRKLSDEHRALAGQVKALREKGVAWWQIGFELKLPGSADNVREGKSGASFARRIYASEFGAVPRTQRRTGGGEKNADVKAIKSQRKMDRVEQVKSGKSVLRESMTDEEVVETLRGRVIGWTTNIARYCEMNGPVDDDESMFFEQEAGVHRKWCKIEVYSGDRCVVFKEFEPRAPLKYRGIAGKTRIVRLSQIHTVR